MPPVLRILFLFSLFASTLHIAFAYKTIIDVLSEDSRFRLLIEHLQRTRLVPIVNRLEAGTLFAPDNNAFENYKDKDIPQSLLLYHLLPVGMTGQDFYHGQLVESLYIRPGFLGSDDAGQRIKITKDGKQGKGRGKVYINGAEIIEKDVYVNNQTYIQVINQVLEPPPMLSDVIKVNEELYSLMEKAGVHNILNQPRPYTVFIPRQSVLSKMNSIEQAYITSKYGEEDLTRLLKYMIVQDPLYGNTFPSGRTLYKSLSGESLVVGVDKDNSLSVNGANVAEADVLAANGVVHIVDDVLIPDSIIFNSRKYLYGMNATKLVSLMDRHGLAGYLDDDTKNVTIIAPLNENIDEDSIPNKEKENWLQYHVVDGAWPTETLYDGMLLKSEFRSPRLTNASQRIPVHVETEKSLLFNLASGSKSVRFDHSRALSDPVSIRGDVIYKVSEPLTLPGNILSTLVIDLELSTFIATLYVSEVADDIKNTPGITMFVPTNDAFHQLGLVAQYLVHPAGKADLQSVLRYHVAKELLYKEDMLQNIHEVTTLADATLRISQSEDGGKIQVSRPETASEVGYVTQADILVRNGVVHKLDRVQVPSYVTITAKDILEGIEANTMMELLEKAGLLPELDKKEYILLSPTDSAFAHIDTEALLADQYQLERVAKLHLIPVGWQDKWLHEYTSSEEYPTLLSDKDKLTMRETETGELLISVKDQTNGPVARVTGMGKTYGGIGGGVLQTDTVLIPIRRGFFGLPWGWSIVLVTGLSLIGAGILATVGFFVYKIWTRRRLGYRSISSS